MSIDLSSVMILLALQLSAFGWRVAREIDAGEPHPFPWVPVPDNVNVAAMLAVAYTGVVVPFADPLRASLVLSPAGRAMFAAAVVLIVAHPLVVASHYRLWSGDRGASGGAEQAPPPYCTLQEGALQLLALIAAGAVFVRVLQASG